MFRANYRAAQGQAGQGSPGGGYQMDQPEGFFGIVVIASQPSADIPFYVVPQVDTADFVASALSDQEPIVQAPVFTIGRISLALGAAAAAGATQPSYVIKRKRGAATATIATYDGTALTFAAFVPLHKTGAALANNTLLSADVLTFQVAKNSTGADSQLAALSIDIEG